MVIWDQICLPRLQKLFLQVVHYICRDKIERAACSSGGRILSGLNVYSAHRIGHTGWHSILFRLGSLTVTTALWSTSLVNSCTGTRCFSALVDGRRAGVGSCVGVGLDLFFRLS